MLYRELQSASIFAANYQGLSGDFYELSQRTHGAFPIATFSVSITKQLQWSSNDFRFLFAHKVNHNRFSK